MTEHDVNTQIGLALHRLRGAKSLTVTQLAGLSGVSSGMISRVENGQVSPSLSTLEALARGLDVQLMSLFAFTSNASDIHYVPAGQGLASQRISSGHVHDYLLLGKHVDGYGVFSSACVVLRREESGDLPQYQHEGYVLMYIISGRAIYACGGHEFDMSDGASLSFDAKLPHGFVKIVSAEVHALTVSTRPV